MSRALPHQSTRLNEATGQYLRNAIVTVAGTTVTDVSGSGGTYTLTNVPAGSVEVTVSYAGLDAQTVKVQVGAGQTVERDINLRSGSYSEVVKMGDFVVASEREGNAKAIMDQRNAENMKKVIASDVFGKVRRTTSASSSS